jgi:hypothetical protein
MHTLLPLLATFDLFVVVHFFCNVHVYTYIAKAVDYMYTLQEKWTTTLLSVQFYEFEPYWALPHWRCRCLSRRQRWRWCGLG